MEKRIYDSYNKTVLFNHRPMSPAHSSFWGYLTPRWVKSEDAKSREITCELGSFWDEQKLIDLARYMDRAKPAMRRCFKLGGIEAHYKDMRKRGSSGYPKMTGESLQLEGDSFISMIGVPLDESIDVTVSRMCAFKSSWALLEMVLRGLIPTPDLAIRPPIIDDVIEGRIAFK